MWEMVRYSNGFALKYDGRVVAINSGRSAYRALIDFGGIVANLTQAVAA